jgi:hypothetical protein
MMKTQKVKGLKIVPPKHTSGDYPTGEYLPRMHQVCIAVGKRNSGKTVAVTNLIVQMKYDYCIVVSPTIRSNKEMMDTLKVEHVYEDVDDLTVIDQIKKIVEDEATDLQRYRDELRRYKKMMRALENGLPTNDDDLIAFFSDRDFQIPVHRWNGEKPRIACVFDDAMGSQLYSKPRKLNALATYSRHIGQMNEGGSIGLSLFFMIQSFKAQVGGLNKVIRNQCTSLLLFKTKDNAELADVADSVGGEIDKDTFIKVYERAIGAGKNHEFLFIDLHPKKHMFRKNFDEFIIV